MICCSDVLQSADERSQCLKAGHGQTTGKCLVNSRKLGRAKVVKAVIDGLRTGVDDYEEYSGWDFEGSNEAFLKSCIFREIADQFITSSEDTQSVFVDLELAQNHLTESASRKGRPRAALRGNPRFDLLLWSGNNPWGVLEVKSFPQSSSRSKVDRDIKRIVALLSAPQHKTIKLGIFAYFYACKREETHKRYLRNLLSRIDELLNDENFSVLSETRKGRAKRDDYFYFLGAISIEKKRYTKVS